MTDTKTVEERIYLQITGDMYEDAMVEGVTWCADMINDTDVEYIRADVAEAKAAEAQREALQEAAKVIKGINWQWDVSTGETHGKCLQAIEQLGDSDHE